jgi:hypothetical protein
MQKYEKQMYLDLEKRGIVSFTCEIYLTNITEEQATSYPRSVDNVENQSPVKICVLSSVHVIV